MNAIILMLISTGSLIVGVILWQKGNRLLAKGKKAQAIIFRNEFEPDRTSGGTYYPVVRFLTDKQEWVTQRLSIGYTPAKTEGSKIEVIYDPADPTTVEINSSWQLEILPRLLVAIGAVGLTLVVLVFLGYVVLPADEK